MMPNGVDYKIIGPKYLWSAAPRSSNVGGWVRASVIIIIKSSLTNSDSFSDYGTNLRHFKGNSVTLSTSWVSFLNISGIFGVSLVYLM